MRTNSIQQNIAYAGKSIAILWNKSHVYVILIVFNIFISALSVFPGMFLLRYSLDMLTEGILIRKYYTVIAITVLVILLFGLIQNYINNKINYLRQKVEFLIRRDIVDICMRIEFQYIEDKNFLEEKEFALAAITEGKLETVINSIAGIISALIIFICSMFIIVTVRIIVLIPFLISMLCKIYYNLKNAKRKYADTKLRTETIRKVNYLSKIVQNFEYAKEIRIFNLKERFLRRIDELQNILYITKKKNALYIIGLAMFLFYFSDFILDIGIYVGLGYEVLVVHSITVGDFSLISTTTSTIKNRLSDLIYNFIDFSANIAYVKAFFKFYNRKEEYAANKDSGRLELQLPEDFEIEFKNVSFKYPYSDNFCLKNINIKIRSNQSLLIVGENGAGKSTFVKLLTGLYKPTSGTILLNGVDISEYTHDSYNRMFSTVFQDYKLFAVTLLENITSMQDAIDEEKLDRAITNSQIRNKIETLPLRIQTPLYRIFDNNGIELSGGEMQKVAIARALYKEAPVIILDEPTSALDPRAEHQIYSCFNRIADNRTSIYISHRLSSSGFCDVIAVFDKGKIVEYGSHRDLINNNGIYCELYNMQAQLYQKETDESVNL